VRVMCEQRAQFPALFTGLKPEHALKDDAVLRLASPPKAEATGSNPVGCARKSST